MRMYKGKEKQLKRDIMIKKNLQNCVENEDIWKI